MRAMRKTLVFVSVLALVPAAAGAQEFVEGHGPGVGIEENLGGLSGGSFVWDAGRFRIDAILGIAHESERGNGSVTDFGVGGRFFFVVHRMERADFSLGGGFAVVHEDVDGGPNETNLQIELAAQIRAFVAPNVALSGSLGFAIVTADNNIILGGPVTSGNGDGAFGFGGQLLAGFGVTYYFR
jgi:hypothetical protein